MEIKAKGKIMAKGTQELKGQKLENGQVIELRSGQKFLIRSVETVESHRANGHDGLADIMVRTGWTHDIYATKPRGKKVYTFYLDASRWTNTTIGDVGYMGF